MHVRKGTAGTVVLCALVSSFAAFPSISWAAARTRTRTAAASSASTASGTDTAKTLRSEWKMGDLKLTREAVDDASFAPDIKSAAIDAVDWFTQQQEGLIAKAQSDPKTAASARVTRAQLQAQFNKKMAKIYNDPKLMAELNRSLKALDNEVDDMASTANKMFAKLNTVGLTAQQQAQIRPVIQQASAKIKATVQKSKTRSAKDQDARDDVVQAYREARAKVKQQLTAAQRAKLAQVNAQEKN